MNICQVITRLIIGGAQENTVLTCRGLAEKGHQVTLIAGPETGPEGSLWDHAYAAGCEVVRLDSLKRVITPLGDRRAGQELRRLFERIRPDVVHTHSSKAGILGRNAARRAGVPVVVHTIHGMSFNRTQPAWRRAAYRWLERRAAAATTSFITVADAMIDQAVEARIAPRDRFTTIRSGIETDRFAPCPDARARSRSAWGVANDEIVVGTIARLFENKGYEEILSAMPRIVAKAPKARFVWIGDGAQRRAYERRLQRMGLRDRVHLIGLVPPAEVAPCINGFDIVLHASRWEGLPRALVQGLLCEVPAVSFDNDGAPEVVIPSETGMLVPLGDISRLGDAVIDLATNAELRRQMGREGRARCLVQYDWRTMVEQLEAKYVGLLSASRER